MQKDLFLVAALEILVSTQRALHHRVNKIEHRDQQKGMKLAYGKGSLQADHIY